MKLLDGVADGTRTHDNRNHNPGLYQLSYSHHRADEYMPSPTTLAASVAWGRAGAAQFDAALAAAAAALAEAVRSTLKRVCKAS